MGYFARELFLMGAPLIVGGVLIVLSILAVKRGSATESKYHILFWPGLALVLFGLWRVYREVFR